VTLLVIGGGGYASNGAAVVAAGSSPALLVQLTEADPPGPDTPQVLTGRSFVQRVISPGAAVALQVAGVIQAAAGELLFSLPSAGLAPLLPLGVPSVALTHTVSELVTGGEVLLLSRPFILVPANGGAGGPGGVVRVVTAAGPVAIAATDQIVSIQNNVATTANLPASPTVGQGHTIKDGLGVAADQPITVVPASGTIDGETEYVLGSPWASGNFIWDGSQWSVI
jgi:hypothetical protein